MDNEHLKIDEITAKNRRIYISDGQIILNIRYPYCIDLDRCDTPEKILGWTRQLSEKNWVTAEILYQFIRLAFNRIGIELTNNI